jgi:hypothetical protein
VNTTFQAAQREINSPAQHAWRTNPYAVVFSQLKFNRKELCRFETTQRHLKSLRRTLTRDCHRLDRDASLCRFADDTSDMNSPSRKPMVNLIDGGRLQVNRYPTKRSSAVLRRHSCRRQESSAHLEPLPFCRRHGQSDRWPVVCKSTDISTKRSSAVLRRHSRPSESSPAVNRDGPVASNVPFGRYAFCRFEATRPAHFRRMMRLSAVPSASA